MKNVFLILVSFIFAAIGCTKNETKAKGTLLRIENTTNETLQEVISNNISFGAIDALSITDYHSFDVPVLPTATIIKGTDTLRIGIYYIDSPQPTLQNGKYTLRIFKDSESYSGFNCLSIKD